MNPTVKSLSVLFFCIFLSGNFIAYANQDAVQNKKWVIASISEGQTVVDDGLAEVIDQGVEQKKREQIASQLGFLSRQLGGMPEMPEIESLEGMAQVPDMKGKTFNYPGIQSYPNSQDSKSE